MICICRNSHADRVSYNSQQESIFSSAYPTLAGPRTLNPTSSVYSYQLYYFPYRSATQRYHSLAELPLSSPFSSRTQSALFPARRFVLLFFTVRVHTAVVRVRSPLLFAAAATIFTVFAAATVICAIVD